MEINGLPGITKAQMTEVDRIMMKELNIPISLMMEHAGYNLAKLLLNFRNSENQKYYFIVGSGNNGDGGLVAARRLMNWGLKVEIIIPRGTKSLKEIPYNQYIRIKSLKSDFIEILPKKMNENGIVVNTYLDYNYIIREDEITDKVINIFENSQNIISLDVPSGLDINSGSNYGNFKPLATLTIAFVKKGLIKANKKYR